MADSERCVLLGMRSLVRSLCRLEATIAENLSMGVQFARKVPETDVIRGNLARVLYKVKCLCYAVGWVWCPELNNKIRLLT
jgi:hypothetical protein